MLPGAGIGGGQARVALTIRDRGPPFLLIAAITLEGNGDMAMREAAKKRQWWTGECAQVHSQHLASAVRLGQSGS